MRTLSTTAAWISLTAGTALAAPHGLYLTHAGLAHLPPAPRAAATELYYGGPVISTVKVVAVIWGKSVNKQIATGLPAFFTAVTNSTWFDILAQYATNLTGVDGHKGTNQTIGRGSFSSEVTITPHITKTSLTDRQVQQELLYQINHHVLPAPDANTLYMTYFPAGTTITLDGFVSCRDYGAYHEGFKTKATGAILYGVMPDCGYSFPEETYVSSHELAEATTDAFPTPGSNPAYPQAWNSSNGSEIADLCEGDEGTVKVTGGHDVTVTQVWSNTTNACSTGNYTSP